MAKPTLKILRCEHRKIFESMLGHFTTLCMKGLKSGTYYPYRKQNNKILYIHKQAKHLSYTIKQIPSMISKRVSDISCDSDHFNKAVPEYCYYHYYFYVNLVF